MGLCDKTKTAKIGKICETLSPWEPMTKRFNQNFTHTTSCNPVGVKL